MIARRSARKSRRTSASEGFSLLEAIVTLVLLAMMLAMLPGVLDLGRQVLRAERRVEQEDQSGSAEAVLRRLISTIRPVRRLAADDRVLIDFNGEAEAVTFVAEAPDALSSAGLMTYRIGLAPARTGGTGRRDLVLVLGRSAGPDRVADDARHSVLLEDVDQLSLAYFGSSPEDTTPRWLQRWTDRDRLPQLVEITVTQDGRVRRIVHSIARAVLR